MLSHFEEIFAQQIGDGTGNLVSIIEDDNNEDA
jgi:hypothetical protein